MPATGMAVGNHVEVRSGLASEALGGLARDHDANASDRRRIRHRAGANSLPAGGLWILRISAVMRPDLLTQNPKVRNPGDAPRSGRTRASSGMYGGLRILAPRPAGTVWESSRLQCRAVPGGIRRWTEGSRAGRIDSLFDRFARGHLTLGDDTIGAEGAVVMAVRAGMRESRLDLAERLRLPLDGDARSGAGIGAVCREPPRASLVCRRGA